MKKLFTSLLHQALCEVLAESEKFNDSVGTNTNTVKIEIVKNALLMVEEFVMLTKAMRPLAVSRVQNRMQNIYASN